MRTIMTLACTCLVVCPACHRPDVRMTQLQIRQMQTRAYEIKDPKRAIKAVLNVLQDEAFIPRQVNLDVGFVHAVKEMDVEDGSEKFWAKFWHGSRNSRWRKNAIVECAANVTETRNGMRLRVNFQVKVMNNKGEVVSVEAIEDPFFYQAFLAKVDKGVFIEKQGL